MPTRYRDLQAPVMPEVGNLRTNSAATAQRISDAFTQFQNTTLAVAAPALDQRGEMMGRREGLAGNPKPRKGLRALSIAGRAYNSAAEAAYAAKVQTDIDDFVSRVEQETAGDLDTYTARTKGYSDELMKSVPPEYREHVGLILGSRIANGDLRIRGQVIADTKAQAHASYLKGAMSGAANAISTAQALGGAEGDDALLSAIEDNQAQLDALVADRVITPEQAVKYAAEYANTLDEGLQASRVSSFVDELMATARVNVLAGDRALAVLESRDDLPPELKLDIRKAYRTERELLDFERSRQRVDESGELARKLAGGAFGDDVEQINAELYGAGAISKDEYQSNISSMERNANKDVDDGADMQAVLDALASGRGLDPTNTKQREAVDKLFRAGSAAAGMQQGDPRWTASALDMAAKTNILPASVQSWARINMLSGDPEQVAQGATFFARVQEANPAAWPYSDDPRLASFAEQINSAVAAGVSNERAMEMARKNAYETTDSQQKILAQRYRDEKVFEENAGALQDALNNDDTFDPEVFSGAPPAPLSMQSEYDRLVQQFYNYTDGNIEKAREMASTAVRSRYGRTLVNGEPEIIKYAPEKMYGIPAELIRQDLSTALAPLGVDPAKVRLVPGPMTEDSKGLEWQLQSTDEDGMFDVVRDERNRPLRYVLPVGQDFDTARKAIVEKRIVEAEERARQNKARREAIENSPLNFGPFE